MVCFNYIIGLPLRWKDISKLRHVALLLFLGPLGLKIEVSTHLYSTLNFWDSISTGIWIISFYMSYRSFHLCVVATLYHRSPSFGITDDTIDIHNDCLQCHQWWQNCHQHSLWFSVILSCVILEWIGILCVYVYTFTYLRGMGYT